MEEVIKYLVETLGLQEKQINAVLGMLSEGATIPFIARYRKDATGNLDELLKNNINIKKTYLQENKM